MDSERMKTLIAESNILTETERMYWTQSLPKMNEQQLMQLEEILTKAKDIPWTEQVQKYFSHIAKSAKSLVS